MKVTFFPSVSRGTVAAPPSKSIAHRALICGALSAQSTVHGLSGSDDERATRRALQTLGASVVGAGDTVQIGGLNPRALPGVTLDCGESGSTLRFLLPLCLCGDVPITLTGRPRLMERPLTVYRTLCEENGLMFRQTETGVSVCGPLKSGHFSVPGDVSSQFISGLLFALPMLERESTLEITGRIESLPYIGLTVQTLAQFGVAVNRAGQIFTVAPQRVQSRTVTVEGDYSNAAFLDAFRLFGGTGAVTNLNPSSIQGDRIYKLYFDSLQKTGAVLDLADCPDLAPVLLAVAAAKHGGTFLHTARLRLKESDRGACMRTELLKFGVPIKVDADSITVPDVPLHAPDAILLSHNDHRIAMALSVLCAHTGGTLRGAEAVTKSFPDFFDRIRTLGIDFRISDEKTG